MVHPRFRLCAYGSVGQYFYVVAQIAFPRYFWLGACVLQCCLNITPLYFFHATTRAHDPETLQFAQSSS